ncbi:MAG: hypothetical protein ACLTJ8_01035 [Veillonella atypica]
MTSVAAKHARGKKLKDVIFVTAGQAAEDTKLNGREKCSKWYSWVLA